MLKLKPSRVNGCCLAAVIWLAAPVSVLAQDQPQVPQQYKRLFVHYVDQRSITERGLNLIGLTANDVGRSFAIVAGVSHYPRLPVGQRELRPAEVDRQKLVAYLQNEELFDEIVVLWDEDMTASNLNYFLKEYFPNRLKKFPKSRFLFAYSGHGFLQGDKGYVLTNGALSFDDLNDAIDLATIRNELNYDVSAGYQILALINSCYGGAFLTRTSFGNVYLPRHSGAHAITSGASNEKSWSDSTVGAGSVFFEKLIAGLGGAADRIPDGGDGIVTVSELYAYLRQEVEVSTDQQQNPQLGDLSTAQSEGEFFFLNRRRQVNAQLIPPWNPTQRISIGDARVADSGVEAQTPASTALRTFTGTWPTQPTNGGAVYLGGTFGDTDSIRFDGSFHVELSLSQSNARYERVECRSSAINKTFIADLSPGFGRPNVHIDLNLVFTVSVATVRPSDMLSIEAIAGGGFEVAPFSSSNYNFQSYGIEFTGTWTAKSGNSEYYGDIRSAFPTGRGPAADLNLSFNPNHFPSEITVTNLVWAGGSNNNGNANLIDTTIDGIHIKVYARVVEFPVFRGPLGPMRAN